MAAGTVTITEKDWGSVKKITFAWVAGTAGDAGTAEGTTVNSYEGKLILLSTVPSVSAQPDDDYDITIADDDGVDLLAGNGADRDETNQEFVTEANMGAVAVSKLTFSVSGAGASNEGTAYLYIR
jgi:hypothetical protein